MKVDDTVEWTADELADEVRRIVSLLTPLMEPISSISVDAAWFDCWLRIPTGNLRAMDTPRQFSHIDDVFGKGDIGINPLKPTTMSLKGHKKGKYFDTGVIQAAMQAGDLENVSPHGLSSPQTQVTRDGVQRYLDGGKNRDGSTYRTVLSGNHRAVAALIRGEDLPAIVARGKTTHPDGSVT